MPGMAPFDEREGKYIKMVTEECRSGNVNQKDVVEKVREVINKSRFQKRLMEIETTRVAIVEDFVIKKLRDMGF